MNNYRSFQTTIQHQHFLSTIAKAIVIKFLSLQGKNPYQILKAYIRHNKVTK